MVTTYIALIIYSFIFYRVPFLGLHVEGELLALILIFILVLRKPVALFNGHHLHLQLINLAHFGVALFWILMSSGDLQYLYPVLRNFISIAAAFSICFLLRGEINTLTIPLFVLLTQILAIYGCFFNYGICGDIQNFMHGEAYERLMSDYVGQRGFSVSSSLAFGLSSSLVFLVLYVVYIRDHSELDYRIPTIWYLIVMFPAVLSVARISIVGFGLSLIYLLLFSKQKIQTLISAMFIAMIAIYSLKYVSDDLVRLGKFIFELFYNYLENNSFGTSSSQKLFTNMIYTIETDTLLHGSGQYINDDGSYYGHTDSGIMRPILFFGVFCFSLLLISHAWIYVYYFGIKNKMGILCLAFLFTSTIYQVKGDMIGYSVDFTSAISLIIFSIMFRKRENAKV